MGSKMLLSLHLRTAFLIKIYRNKHKIRELKDTRIIFPSILINIVYPLQRCFNINSIMTMSATTLGKLARKVISCRKLDIIKCD